MMRALIVTEPGKIEIGQVPRPEVGPYQALVRTTCCGICNSTDWKIIHGQMAWAGDFPLLLGHESVGVVEQVGNRVQHFKVGEQVTRVINPRTATMGSAWGGFAEFGIVTDARAMADDGDPSLLEDYNAARQQVVPAQVTPIKAALAISLAETASVLDAIPCLAGRRVLVAGTGVAGLALALWSKMAGARRVVVLGRRAARLKQARHLAADAAVDTALDDWENQAIQALDGPAEVIFEAIGDAAFATRLLPLLASGGAAIAYGAPPDGQTFDPRWQGAQVKEQDRYNWVIDLMRRNLLDSQEWISHRWPFDDAIEAFEAARRGGVFKGFIEF